MTSTRRRTRGVVGELVRFDDGSTDGERKTTKTKPGGEQVSVC